MTLYLARHAETVFNAARRMQGAIPHTPLTRTGFAQADAMGQAVHRHLGARPAIEIWASPSGRTVQTCVIIAEHLGFSFDDIRTDSRLAEIDVGRWEGRLYGDIVAESGTIMCPQRRAFDVRPPGGEWYPQLADRLRSWRDERDMQADMLVVSHGLALRVLRGMLVGGEPFHGVPLANDVPQGSVLEIGDGGERLLHLGSGPRAAPSV